MTFETIKADTPKPHPRVISEVEKQGKSDIRMARIGTQEYKTSPSTKSFNNVTTFKNTPKMFKMDTTYTLKYIYTHNTLLA